MSGLFKRLKQELDKRQQEQGIRPTDLLELPAAQRRVMRILMREVQLDYPTLTATVAALRENQRLSTAELDEALAQLVANGWIIRLGQEALITYRVNLRRKAGSQLSDNIWGNLQQRLQDRSAPNADN